MKQFVALLLAALMAGCTGTPYDGDSGNGIEPGPGFAPQRGFQEDLDGELHLVGVLSPCAAGFCVNATASIEGNRPYYVSNICVDPHEDRMERDEKPIQHREPTYHCEAFGLREWTRDEHITFQYVWDGQIWDDASNSLVAAERGAYQWTIMFHAWDEPGGGPRHTLSVTFTVVIGET